MSDTDEVPIEKIPTKKAKKISLAEPIVEKSVEKPREYVMTPARKAALERMKVARQAKVLEIQQKKAEDAKLLEEAKKKKTKPKKQVIVYESESSEEEENQIVIRKKRKPVKKTEPVPDDDDTPPPTPPPIPRLRRL